MVDDTRSMSVREFHGFAHPLLRRRFYLALFFSMLLFPLIVVGLIAGTIFLVIPAIALVLWISMRVLFAWLIGNTIVVSELNFPAIHAIAEEMKQKIGYKGKIYIFVYESKSFNAWMQHVFFRHAIFLNSEMLVTGVGEDEMRWIIGRFIGYLRTRKQAGLLGMLIRTARRLIVFDLFLLPYERAMVYTGDRLALAALKGDILSAATAMQKLTVGRELGYSINPEGMIAQLREVKGTLFGFLARLVTSFPHNAARYVDLLVFAKQFYPERFVVFEAMNPGLPQDLRRLVAVPRPDPAPGSAGIVADAGPPRGWLLAGSMLTAMVAMVLWLAISANFMSGLFYGRPPLSLQDFPAADSNPLPEAPPLPDNPVPQEIPVAPVVPVQQENPIVVPETPPIQESPAQIEVPPAPLTPTAPEIPALPENVPALQPPPVPEAPTQPATAPPGPAPGPNLHWSNTGWLPDAGCKWASEDTSNLSVTCE